MVGRECGLMQVEIGITCIIASFVLSLNEGAAAKAEILA